MSTTPTHRWKIIQKADGRIYVETATAFGTGHYYACASIHDGYFTTVEEAHAEIARQKARFEATRLASQETVLHEEEA